MSVAAKNKGPVAWTEQGGEYAMERLLVRFGAGRFAWRADGVTLGAAAIEARLLVGEAEKLYVWRPDGGAAEPDYAERRSPAGSIHEYTYVWTDEAGYRFTWSIGLLPQLSAITLRASFANGSAETVRLRDFALCRTEERALSCAGDAAGWLLRPLEQVTNIGNLAETLRSFNEETVRMWEGFGMPVPTELSDDERDTDGRWRVYNDFVTLYADAGTRGMAFGAAGRPEADVRFACKVDDGAMRFDIVSEMSDVTVDPGERRVSQEVVAIAGSYEPAVEALLRWTAATHGHRTHRKPVKVWNSWYDYRQHITEENVLRNIAALTELKERLPLDVIQIDQGYEMGGGDWRCNEKFPEGFHTIIKRIRAAGAVPGIWIAPLCVDEIAGWIGTYPDRLQRDSKGGLLDEGHNFRAPVRWMDPTHPEARAFIRRELRLLYNQGFRHFKIDFNIVNPRARLHNPKKTRLQALRELYAMYRETVGEESHLLACSTFVRGVFGYADSVRIGPDSTAYWYGLNPCSLLESIRAVGANAIANGILFTNDPDTTYAVIPVFDNVPELKPGELRTWHNFFGLLGGTMQFADRIFDPAFIPAMRPLEVMLPAAPDKGRPLQGGADLEHRRFGFVAERPWGSFAAVVLWNPEEEAAQVPLVDSRGVVQQADATLRGVVQQADATLRGADRSAGAAQSGADQPPGSAPTAFGDRLGERFHAWSFWEERYLGVADGGFRSDLLNPHESQLLRFTPLSADPKTPTLVGTTLHMAMGSAEIVALVASPDKLDIALDGDAGATDGKLVFHSAREMELAEAQGCVVRCVVETEPDIWTVELTERKRGQIARLRFAIGGDARE